MKKIVRFLFLAIALLSMCIRALADEYDIEELVGTWRYFSDSGYTITINSDYTLDENMHGEKSHALVSTNSGNTTIYYPEENETYQVRLRLMNGGKEQLVLTLDGIDYKFLRVESSKATATPKGKATATATPKRSVCKLCKNGWISCPGEDFLICPKCKKESEGYYETCVFCNGKGSTTCGYCSGSGRTICDSCNGHPVTSGGKNKEEIRRNMIIKTNCALNGCVNGYMRCKHCNKGKAECWYCDGRGKKITITYQCKTCKVELVCGACLQPVSEGHAKYRCPLDSTVKPKEFVYNNVMRNPKQYIGTEYQLSGKISSVKELFDGVYSLCLSYSDNGETRRCDIRYLQTKNADRLLNGDSVTMYGRFVSYDATNTPTFVVYYAEVK